MSSRDKQLLSQLHFYFSDSNLANDKYLKSIILKSEDGWVPLSIITSFNKIKTITGKIADLQRALQKSSILTLSDDKLQIKRKLKYIEKEIDDKSIIYVEKLSPYWNRDTISKIFSKYGKITNITLPRDKQSNHLRGFCFVEFNTVESAQKALEMNGRREPSWVNSLSVISKCDWINRKIEFQTLMKRQPTYQNDIITQSLLYIENLNENSTIRSILQLMTMIGPVRFFDICRPGVQSFSKFVTPSSCLIRYGSSVCTERCLCFFDSQKQYMIDDIPISVRKLTSEEENEYESSRNRVSKKRENDSVSAIYKRQCVE